MTLRPGQALVAAGHVRGVDDDALVTRRRRPGRSGRGHGGTGDRCRSGIARRPRRSARRARPGDGRRHRRTHPAPRDPEAVRAASSSSASARTSRQGAQAGASRRGSTRSRSLKRYSTVTMGPCQGKMCHGLAARVHAQLAGNSPAQTGLTTARPPFQPVTLAALAGPHLARVRRTAMHERHDALGRDVDRHGRLEAPAPLRRRRRRGQGRPRGGRPDRRQHARQARRPGPGRRRVPRLAPPEPVQRPAGRARALPRDARRRRHPPRRRHRRPACRRTGSSCPRRPATSRRSTSGCAGGSPARSRRVAVTDVTGQYAAVNLAGPRAREVLQQVTDLDVSKAGMPYLAAVEGAVAGIPAMILRIGFVGELGYEIHVPADYGAHLWDALMDAGRPLGLRPFGVEAQRVLRLEKQHAIVGQDTDALSTRSRPAWAGSSRPRSRTSSAVTRRHRSPRAGPRQVLTGFEIVEGGRSDRGRGDHPRRRRDRAGDERQVEPHARPGDRTGVARRPRKQSKAARSPSGSASAAKGRRARPSSGRSRSTTPTASGLRS